jgi:nucleoside-diphosphate-sugar epimerase
VHVLDVIAAALLAAADPRSDGRVYLLTDGAPYSTRWLYERIRRALGRPVPVWTVPLWFLRSAAAAGTLAQQVLGRRLPLDREGLSKLTGDAWFSSERIRAELGFRPRHSLAAAIPEMVREHLRTGGG